MTRAQARIDLAAFAHNLSVLRAAAPNSQQMAIVKADAYGHGLLPMARAARAAGAEWLGVALFSEALELRAAGDTGPLLTWLASPDDPWEAVLDAGIDVGVSTPDQLERVAATGRRARLHLKLDTGLGRAGCPPHLWEHFVVRAKALQDAGAAEVVAFWSHFTVADDPGNPLNTVQVERFLAGVDEAAALGMSPEHLHLANSAATLSLPDAHFTMVRPGIAMYGISPGAAMGTPQELGLRPVMTLVARMSTVKHLPAGAGLSYGHLYTLPQGSTTAVIPLGYADGIPRNATNVGPVFAAGKRRTIAGRVCMDQFVLDLGDDHAVEGDEAVLFGDGPGIPLAEDWAQATGTIGYEIVTRLGPRVDRVYYGGDA
ncbi:MAG TPA: alanine racemase [Actinomycetota bacterium]|nr:alanine racemase [Actinomycetota bacterium]